MPQAWCLGFTPFALMNPTFSNIAGVAQSLTLQDSRPSGFATGPKKRSDCPAPACGTSLDCAALAAAVAVWLRVPDPGPCDPIVTYCLYWPFFAGGERLPSCDPVSGAKFSVTINGQPIVCGELRDQRTVVSKRVITEVIGIPDLEVGTPMPISMPTRTR